MTFIRVVEIENFRGMKVLRWLPRPGINCLVGPGDSGKSTILDAIDFCIGARRSIQITDADFYAVNTDQPIRICVTIGALPDALKTIDGYGLYLRGFNSDTGLVEAEPEANLETVITIQLVVESDLEPQWSLLSERAAAQNQSRSLSWPDRVKLSPTRLGALNDNNLTWRRGSILNRLSEERPDASKELSQAARDVRAAFGAQGNEQLAQSLAIITAAAHQLGIPIGVTAKALLDAASVSFSAGTISLHDEAGVPLRGLGLGSTRLLIAGIQRKASAQSSIILVDELEHGLEPHRILLLLAALGSKDTHPPLQVFVTTHSPVAVRELSADQLFVLRPCGTHHEARHVGSADDVQGTIRKYPDALLATSIIVCEGASEVGLLRGLDQYRTMAIGSPALPAYGVALVDGGGHETFRRATAFQSLGFRVAVLRDSDAHQTPDLEAAFAANGGTIFAWPTGLALEDVMFQGLSATAVQSLLALAASIKDESLVNEHIRTASQGTSDLARSAADCATGPAQASRTMLGVAAKLKGNKGWFKSVSAMEEAGRAIIGPDLPSAWPPIGVMVESIFAWAADGRA